MKISLLFCLASAVLIPVIAAPNKKHHSKRDIDPPREPEVNHEPEVPEPSAIPAEILHEKKHAAHHKRFHLKRASSSDSNDTTTNDTKPVWPIIHLPVINDINYDYQQANPFSVVVDLALKKHKHNNKHHSKRDGAEAQSETEVLDGKDSQDGKDDQDGKDQSNQLWDPLELFNKYLETQFKPLSVSHRKKYHSKRVKGDADNLDGKDDDQDDAWTKFFEDARKKRAKSNSLGIPSNRKQARKHSKENASNEKNHSKEKVSNEQDGEDGESDQIVETIDLGNKTFNGTQKPELEVYVYFITFIEGDSSPRVEFIHLSTALLKNYHLNPQVEFADLCTPLLKKHHHKRDGGSGANEGIHD